MNRSATYNKPITIRPSNTAKLVIKEAMRQHPQRSQNAVINILLESLADGQSEQPSEGDKAFSSLSMFRDYPPRLACPIIGRYAEAQELLPKCKDCIRKQQGTCGAWQQF